MSGWISIQRKIREHWIWQDPVKLKWWLDILLTVNHASSKVNIGMQLFDCEKGQSVMSLQSWADRWGVSKDTTRNFFVLLEKDGMISTENLKKTTRLTVCNYETYQSGLHDEQTIAKRQPNAGQTQAGTNNNENNSNKKNKSKKSDLDYSVIDSDYLNMVKDWLDYKTARKETYKSQQALLSFIKKLKEISNESPGVARKIIEQSMANNWAGIFELKSQQHDNRKFDKRANREPATADQLAKDDGW